MTITPSPTPLTLFAIARIISLPLSPVKQLTPAESLFTIPTMQNLIRRLWGERGTYGLSIDGAALSAASVRPLSGGRTRVELLERPPNRSWLTVRRDFTFIIRHARVPLDYQGDLDNYVRAFASDIFPIKEETMVVRTDGVRDTDGVIFVHGIPDIRRAEILNDVAARGIIPSRAAGLVPSSVALHRAVELLEQRPFPNFIVILHLGHTGAELVAVRGGRPVFHRAISRRESDPSAKPQPHLSLLQHLMVTVEHLADNPYFGIPSEVVLTGPWSNDPAILEEVCILFPKSDIRQMNPCDRIVSETLTAEYARTHVLAIGAAAVGLLRGLSSQIDFLKEPKSTPVEKRPESGYDKIILGCGAAMLALAFVTANAALLDLKKEKLERIAENQKTIETLRDQVRRTRTDLESAEQFLDAVAIRLDLGKSKTFSIPISITKLLSALESAAPLGVTLDKIESGYPPSAAGRYANFFSQGDPVTVTLSGRALLPEYVIEFQDALRDALGVSVDIVSMDREGDFWVRKPVNFVIVLRGPVRRV